MEFLRIWLPYQADFSSVESKEGKGKSKISVSITNCVPIDNNETKKAHNEINELLKKGWEIVSTAPITGTQENESRFNINSYHYSKRETIPHGYTENFEFRKNNYVYTVGIEVFLVKKQ